MPKEKQIEFLYQSISDTQELIKFVETKTAFGASIIGIYLATFCSIFDKVLKHFYDFNFIFWASFILVCILLLVSIWIIILAIKSVNNPADNVKIKKEDKSALEFFVTPNDYDTYKIIYPFFNSKHFKIKKTFDSFFEAISNSDENELIKVLTFELLKVNYIRNIKNDRFKILIFSLIATTLGFFIFYIVFLVSMNNFESLVCKY
jgi:hypothetical protein